MNAVLLSSRTRYNYKAGGSIYAVHGTRICAEIIDGIACRGAERELSWLLDRYPQYLTMPHGAGRINGFLEFSEKNVARVHIKKKYVFTPGSI